jgi:hypothetical protein
MTEEEFVNVLKNLQKEGESKRDILNSLAMMFADDLIGVDQISQGADYLGFQFAEDGLRSLQEQAKQRHPDYPTYVRKLLEDQKTTGHPTSDSLAGYVINAFESGFISADEADQVIKDEGLLYINHMFFFNDDPQLDDVDNELAEKQAKGMNEDAIMEMAYTDYRKEKITFARFALIVAVCGHSFSDAYLKLDERKQKKAKLRDMLA